MVCSRTFSVFPVVFSGSGGDTSSADTANPEGTSTKSSSCNATKIDAEKLLEKFNVVPPPFDPDERELVIESWVAVEQHIAQVRTLPPCRGT